MVHSVYLGLGGPGGMELVGILFLCALCCCAAVCLGGCSDPEDFWDWVGHDMKTEWNAQDCVLNPPGTSDAYGWGFRCGRNMSPTGWCLAVAHYSRALDRCEIDYCRERPKDEIKEHELRHCKCSRIGDDNDHCGECWARLGGDPIYCEWDKQLDAKGER